jgi:hypothetical protein
MASSVALRAREYRERAEELRTVAAALKHRQNRVDLVGLADSYDRMADEVEAEGRRQASATISLYGASIPAAAGKAPHP